MFYYRVTLRLLLLLLLLAASSAATLLLVQRGYYAFAFFTGAVLVGSIMGVIRFNNWNARKLMFMFSSIENGDYSFRFTESRPGRDNTMVNAALNRIRGLLTKARDETIEQEKYFQLILESVTTGIVIVDERGHVVQTNREAIRLLGIEPFTHIVQLKRLDEKFPALMRDIEAGESRQLVCNNERGSVTLSVHASSIFRRGERLKILALTDIENELSDREIESWIRLIRVLTHEIMNSINPITSISDSLVERVGDGDDKQLRQGLETISQTAKGLIAFVESYRKFTRLPAPEPTLFYVREFMESLRSLALATVPEGARPVEIRLSVEPEDLILYADRGLVSQVAINLLKNAIEATLDTENPRIDFTATVDNREQVILTVANNGPSIPPEIADHIFIPFFTTKTGGSGVGLSLSRQIMRLHGGTLKYRPGAEGTGSIFTMTFK
ncbi:sensor histidine kinase [Rikenella microfusus]|uniref:histidine kinase n=1 Tax=Rikenella microfusus TaxID=28139 RepID=A0A379MQG9_9BACT|nr:ATP-binding protein [Rikenella microfusus]SUE32872.1 Sensor protein fixL [Rikenella microfusus]HJE87554.1 PAS domain-containing protein [Rikenella microfusus]